MKNFILVTILVFSLTASFTQDLSVPGEVLKEINYVELGFEGQSRLFQVVFPDNYDSTKTYPVFLGLSGGTPTKRVVNYCYAAWFKNDVYKNYITIMPSGVGHEFLSEKSALEWELILNIIRKHYKVTKKKWILAATSNGGIASFNLLQVAPKTFKKAYLMPGYLPEGMEANRKWRCIRFVLAFGEMDEQEWKDKTNETAKKLKRVEVIEMKGQGHILSLDYDQNSIYRH